ncbi:hypothetical protein D3C74_425760 [compost metagenome]
MRAKNNELFNQLLNICICDSPGEVALQDFLAKHIEDQMEIDIKQVFFVKVDKLIGATEIV